MATLWHPRDWQANLHRLSRRTVLVVSLQASIAAILFAFALPVYKRNLTTSDCWLSTSDQTKQATPYELPGYLAISATDPHANRWIPYEASAYSPMLFASFARQSWALISGPGTAGLNVDDGAAMRGETAPDGRPWIDMTWARGRTVLYVADSIGRDHTKYMCELMGGMYELISPGHTWWPEENASALDLGNLHIENHMPHFCHIPGLDFLIIHVFSFGLDTHYYFAEREFVDPEDYPFEKRITKIGARIVAKASQQMGRRSEKPDAVLLASAMWDNAKWMREDLVAEQSTTSPLSEERITWYHRRIAEITGHVLEAFAATPVIWVTNHYPVGRPGEWFVSDISSQRPAQALNRLFQMNQAVHAAVQSVRAKTHSSWVDMLPWGDLMLGQEGLQRDDLHPLIYPSGYLWADMLLHKLRQYLA